MAFALNSLALQLTPFTCQWRHAAGSSEPELRWQYVAFCSAQRMPRIVMLARGGRPQHGCSTMPGGCQELSRAWTRAAAPHVASLLKRRNLAVGSRLQHEKRMVLVSSVSQYKYTLQATLHVVQSTLRAPTRPSPCQRSLPVSLQHYLLQRPGMLPRTQAAKVKVLPNVRMR